MEFIEITWKNETQLLIEISQLYTVREWKSTNYPNVKCKLGFRDGDLLTSCNTVAEIKDKLITAKVLNPPKDYITVAKKQIR